MLGQPENVSVTHVGSRFGLNAKEGPFRDMNDDVRTWKSESGAVAFLRGSKCAWVVTKLNGKIAYVNCLDPEAEADRQTWGPHKWNKANLVTIDGSRSYDLARCIYCGLVEKRYGLERWTTSGHCPENKHGT